jgi:hypothetical protein
MRCRAASGSYATEHDCLGAVFDEHCNEAPNMLDEGVEEAQIIRTE